MCVSCSVVSDFATPWTVAHQAPLSMEFSRQEYWSGLPFHFPGNLPDPGIGSWLSHIVSLDCLPSEPPEKPWCVCVCVCVCIHTYAKIHTKIPHTDCFMCKYIYKCKDNIMKNSGIWKIAKVVTCKTGDWRGKLLLYNFNFLLEVMYCFCNCFFCLFVCF